MLQDYTGGHQHRSQCHLDSADCCPEDSNWREAGNNFADANAVVAVVVAGGFSVAKV